MRALGRLAGAVLVLALVAGGVLFFQSRDAPEVAPAAGPGEPAPSRCPSRAAGTPRDARALSPDQLDDALAAGNVVLTYGNARAPAALRRLQREVSGRYDAEVAAAGQAVVLARRPGTRGTVALAWQRRLEVPGPRDPRLGEFIDAWLGEGAPRPCRSP